MIDKIAAEKDSIVKEVSALTKKMKALVEAVKGQNNALSPLKTPQTYKRRKCPYCGKVNIRTGNGTFKYSRLSKKYRCKNCGKMFTEDKFKFKITKKGSNYDGLKKLRALLS